MSVIQYGNNIKGFSDNEHELLSTKYQVLSFNDKCLDIVTIYVSLLSFFLIMTLPGTVKYFLRSVST